MLQTFKGHPLVTTLALIALLVGLGASFFNYQAILAIPNIDKVAYGFMVFWLGVAVLFSILSYKEFTVGFLICVLGLLFAWRIAETFHIFLVSYALMIAFCFLCINFFYCIWINLKKPNVFLHALSISEWQLLFLRLYIGFDFVPHATEKLFAGAVVHAHDVAGFMRLGVPHADFFVWLAGLCEFGAVIALGLGFMMRLGAIGTALFLLISTYLGHHFSLGFIWAGSGGGWEYPIMWTILIFSFALTGTHPFSIDQRLEDWFKLPACIKKLM